MKNNIRIIQVGVVISIVSLLVALFLGVSDTPSNLVGPFTISTYQSATFSIFGSCFFAVIVAYVVYENERLKYIELTEKFLFNVCLNCKMLFVHIHEANGILEQQILSKQNKGIISLITTFETSFTKELDKIISLELYVFLQKDLFSLYSELIKQNYNLLQDVVFELRKIKILCDEWEIFENKQSMVQIYKRNSKILNAKKNDLENELKYKIIQLSWQVNHIIEQCGLAIPLIYYLTKKKDKLEKVIKILNEQSESYSQSYKTKQPELDTKLLSEHLLKLIHLLAEIEELLTNSNHPALLQVVFDRYSYLVALSKKYNELKCFCYEIDILFSHDEKMKFYLRKIDENMALFIEEFKTINSNLSVNFVNLEQFLSQNEITILNYGQPNNINKLNNFLVDHCNCSNLYDLCKKLIEIITNEDFKSRLNLYKQD